MALMTAGDNSRTDAQSKSARRSSKRENASVIGKLTPSSARNHRQAILSLVERKSKLTLLKKVERNTAEAIEQAISKLLRPVADKVHTITSDNGREFAQHQAIASKLDAAFYFAHPFASWERGTNENTNGLVRQYFPKGSDFSKITEADIQRATARLNNRPRKRLNYRTPQQVFFKEQKIALTT
jgi:IS30 family transposase